MSDFPKRTSMPGKSDSTLDETLEELIRKASSRYQNQRLERLLIAARMLYARGLDPVRILESAQAVWPDTGVARGALSHDELCILGGNEPLPLASDLEVESARASRRERFEQALRGSLSDLQVAALLQMKRAQVIELAATGKLLAIGPDQAPRFPEFQFSNGRILPHLDIVLSSMRDWHPLTIMVVHHPFCKFACT